MRIISQVAKEDLAGVYVAEFAPGKRVEFVESVQPPRTRQEKWVVIVSTMFGCPIQCKMCDAGGDYAGKMTAPQILAQIDYLVQQRFPAGHIATDMFKLQLARMGEPTLNPAVLDVLKTLPHRYPHPNMVVSLSTIAPHRCQTFMDALPAIKDRHYPTGRFQLQFSIHSTDTAQRDFLIPVKKWSLAQIADFGTHFYRDGDRKITLNFAWGKGMALETHVLRRYFNPDHFLIKITPMNPTYRAAQSGLQTQINDHADISAVQTTLTDLQSAGYDVIVSIGELEENQIGSNCGQYLRRHQQAPISPLSNAYSYGPMPTAHEPPNR